jgi:hypothetical protein
MVKVIERFIFENKDEWKEHRKGLFTGSRVNELMAQGKRLMTKEELAEFKITNPKSKAKYIEDDTVLSDGAISYILELIQNIEAEPKFQYSNYQMEWGINTEPDAVQRFCDLYGYDLQSDDVIFTSIGGTVFFVGDNVIGVTPDLILPDAICQVKCPDSDTHLRYKLFVNSDNIQDELPDYYDQMQVEMMLAERDKGYFFSFDPRFKTEKLQHHTIEIKADKERQNAIYNKVLLCEKQKQEYLKLLNG